MIYKALLFFTLILVFTNDSSAHPVSWKGSVGIMPEISGSRRELEVNYSIASNYAVGLHSIMIDYKEDTAKFILPKFNYRLLRFNQPGSQTNLYLSTGIGGVRYKEEDSTVVIGALQADYETRRIYALLAGETLQSDSKIDLNRIRYRLGFAPYLTDFSGFHTWLIGQVEYTPELKDQWTVTPLVRFFYRNYLIEIGSSTRGKLSLSGIIHF